MQQLHRGLLLACICLPLALAGAFAQDAGKDGKPGEKDDKGNEKPVSVAPAWHVGDWWKVECHPMLGVQPKRPRKGPDLKKDEKTVVTVSFQVADVRDLDGNRCYVIEMINDFDEEKWTWWIRASNLTVKQLEMTGGGATRTIANPSKTYLHADTGLLIPLDFPRLPREGKDETVADTIGETTNEFVQSVKYGDDGRQATVELKWEINGKPMVSRQVWQSGRPWWTEAKRVHDGTEMEAGKLVDWSGKGE